MSGENDIRIVIDAQNNTVQAFGDAARGARTVGDAAQIAGRRLQEESRALDEANRAARRMADAHERSSRQADDLNRRINTLRREIATSGDATGNLTRRLESLRMEYRHVSNATDDAARASNRAAERAREQARAYDHVAAQAREAARAMALFGAGTRLAGHDDGAGSRGMLSRIGGGAAGAAGLAGGNPYLMAAGILGAAGVTNFAGAAAGGAVTLGAGAAGAGAGLAGAWQNDPEKFSAMWSESIGRVQQRWLAASAQFDQPLTQALKRVDKMLRDLPIEEIMASGVGLVDPLVGGATEGITAAAEGFADLAAAAEPIARTIGPELAELGGDIGAAFRMIGSEAEGGGQALADFMDVAGLAIRGVGAAIQGLEAHYEDLRAGAGVWADSIESIPVFGDSIASAGRFLSDFAGGPAPMAARAIEDIGGAAVDLTASMGNVAAAASHMAEEAAEAWGFMRDRALEAANANLGLAQGWLDLREELAEGKKTFDLNTKAGIDNTAAIVDQVEKAEALRQQMLDNNSTFGEANAAYDANIERIRKMATDLGFSKAKVDELLASLKGFNGSEFSATAVLNIKTRGDLDALGLSVGWLTHHAAGGATSGSASRVNDWGHPGGYAAGGAWAGDMAGIGEVIRQPNGSMVIPAGSGRALMRDLATGGGQGGGTQTLVFGSDGSRLGDLLVDVLAVTVKNRGGNPDILGLKIRR